MEAVGKFVQDHPLVHPRSREPCGGGCQESLRKELCSQNPPGQEAIKSRFGKQENQAAREMSHTVPSGERR